MEKLALKSTDIVIAVMGATGVGKSTFIQLFTQQTVIKVEGLESYTEKMEIYKCSTKKITEFCLIDTPGFGNSERDDTDVLRGLTNWLSMYSSDDITLTGIIYLHRISDVRFRVAAMKNLRLFKKFCGKDSLESVVLATTFWSNVDKQTALKEQQLKTEQNFWGGLIARGSKLFRQDDGILSGKRIIDHLIERRYKIVLDIQREMVDRDDRLDQTAAGRAVQAEFMKAKAEYEKQDRREDDI